ncbi:hypothetical protein CLAFUW4_05854 [Fulvia fulva]|nr:hypothetical protein CLAFUR4_05848 [Fulvia fulva]WPV14798.1 hypothetical protein CLAFUW4_05854 [Fulvia fulva]WPV29769.1 hypothetical protein CLAFUW7_05852 [Fulvia fulva]
MSSNIKGRAKPRGNDVEFYSYATLRQDRRHMLWFNRYYSKVTSKGNIVGWYLDPEAHDPYWQNRRTKYVRNPKRKTHHISEKVKEKYEELRLGVISTDLFLTAGELKSLNAMFEEKQPEAAPEAQKPRLNSKEQLDLQNILNNIKNPGVYRRHQRKKAKFWRLDH